MEGADKEEVKNIDNHIDAPEPSDEPQSAAIDE